MEKQEKVIVLVLLAGHDNIYSIYDFPPFQLISTYASASWGSLVSDIT